MNRHDPRRAARHRRHACRMRWPTTHNPVRLYRRAPVYLNGVELVDLDDPLELQGITGRWQCVAQGTGAPSMCGRGTIIAGRKGV